MLSLWCGRSCIAIDRGLFQGASSEACCPAGNACFGIFNDRVCFLDLVNSFFKWTTLTCNRSTASPTDLLGSLFRILTPEASSRAISCHPHALLADRTGLGEKVGDSVRT